MKRIIREFAIVATVVTVLCTLALLFAQGRLFPDALIGSPFDKPVSDGCLYLSLPGLTTAIAIWGYAHEGTKMSDLLIVAVNATLYSTLIIVFLSGLHRCRRASNP